jgi:transcriptional antiterminator RfaH
MPILDREPDLFPDDLLAGDAPAPEHAGRAWLALHTRPRQEKSIARELYRRRVPFYVPLVPHRSLIRGRIVTAHVPLFPGYVFLLASPEERLAALATNRVVQTLPVANQEGLRHDLRQIRQLIASNAPLTVEGALTPGVPVEITAGPLAGLKGKIRRGASGCRFVVEVDFIQQGASVLVDEAFLARTEQLLSGRHGRAPGGTTRAAAGAGRN